MCTIFSFYFVVCKKVTLIFAHANFHGDFTQFLSSAHKSLQCCTYGRRFFNFIFFSRNVRNCRSETTATRHKICKQQCDFLLFLARILLISPPFIFVVHRRFCIQFTHYFKAASSIRHHASIIALISRHSFNKDGALNLIFVSITAAKLQFIIHAPT
jgi:hypothetical protein